MSSDFAEARNNKILEEIENDLVKTIIKAYTPKSTRWNRNHSQVAEWYFIWKDKDILT